MLRSNGSTTAQTQPSLEPCLNNPVVHTLFLALAGHQIDLIKEGNWTNMIRHRVDLAGGHYSRGTPRSFAQSTGHSLYFKTASASWYRHLRACG
ncbi:hypothetical protein PLUA15_210014 [Pseudomonas lundensis]|uniref:Uncharacterized protein n=1 Tax=Pseudomonas lundensis TaxID=86185 RepID=A0AAX2H6I5_9PSED|nr:hypothetical protein PLUA15_210014 [Pseudomonas lundensis]